MSNNRKIKVLVTADLIRESFSELFSRCEITFAGYAIDRKVMLPAELKKRIADTDVLICEYDTISADIIDAATNLKLIVCCRGGVKSVVDLSAAKSRGITVCNNGGRNAVAVSELAVGFMLDMTRNITKTTNLIHDRVITQEFSSKPAEYQDTVWGLDNDSPFVRYRGRSLSHMTIGLVGCGFAGREVAKRVKPFGARILASDPCADSLTLQGLVKLVDLDTLVRESDIISLHCPVTKDNKGFFDAKKFSSMKKGAYFINTARGELVNEADLAEALNSHHLAGAALDVTMKEPMSSDSDLLKVENLIITPHIAGSSDDVQIAGTRMVIESLSDWMQGICPPRRAVRI